MKVPGRSRAIVAVEQIDRAILLLRGQKVMLDFDLALLYGVTTKALNQAVRRNRERFPADFMFELTKEEAQALRSQTVTLKQPQMIRASRTGPSLTGLARRIGLGLSGRVRC